MDQVQIGKFISELRKEKGLTQEQLGERLRRRWIKTAVAIALTIACMVGLYNYEFGVSVAATEDLEQAVNTFHFHEEMSVDVLERVTIGLDDTTVVDIFGRSIRYYGENGDRYTIRQLAESFDTSGSESSSSTGVAETNMIYVLELIVLAIGVIFIRYFMK